MSLENKIMKMKLRRWIKRGLTIGDNFKINNGCSIEPTFPWLVTIGNNVTLAPNVTILAHDASSQVHLGYTRLGLVVIGNNVFVGAGSIILPGVNVGNDVVIAAGSVVTKDVPDGSVIAGVPAKPVKGIDEFRSKYEPLMKERNLLNRSYTIAGNVTPDMKQEMKERLKNETLFIV